MHLLQFQPSRLASKIPPHPYISCFVAISIASRLPRKPALKPAARAHPERLFVLLQVRMVENRSLQQRDANAFSRLAESALFCANFAVAPAGLICLARAILLAVTV